MELPFAAPTAPVLLLFKEPFLKECPSSHLSQRAKGKHHLKNWEIKMPLTERANQQGAKISSLRCLDPEDGKS